MANNIKIVGVAFGPRDSEKVFSGVPKHLFGAMEKRGGFAGYVSTKQLWPWDTFYGMVDLSKILKYGKPGVSRAWLWRKKTVETLTKRFRARLANIGDFNVVLQIGTHVRVELEGIKHYCFTDMTVSQAVQAGQFGLNKFNDVQVSQAIEAQKSILETCQAIFVNSNWAKQSIMDDYGIAAERIGVVGVGASVSPDTYIDAEKKDSNILFLGRDWHRKGGPTLLEAFRLVKQKVKSANLTIVGCSPKIDDKAVSVLGQLDKNHKSQRRLLMQALSRAAVLCVPSLFEPYGICFLEAHLFGIPPVTFRGQGRGEAIKNGVTGILVDSYSTTALSEALLELLLDPDKASRMGRAGREFARANFTWERVAEKILNIIQQHQ